MRVAVIGAGHVGLITAIVLAEKRHDVRCLERDPEIVKALRAGRPHFHEHETKRRLKDALNGPLRILPSNMGSLDGAEVILVCVNTPSRHDGQMDSKDLTSALHMVGEWLRTTDDRPVIVLRSTMTPGTTQGLVKVTLERVSGRHAGIDFGLCCNPEFLREGTAFRDMIDADRIVIGTDHPETRSVMHRLYAAWDSPILDVSPTTAEYIKYGSNTLLSLFISFANELEEIVRRQPDARMDDILHGMALDGRWRSQGGSLPEMLSYLRPGPGFGGHCLPKDLRAMISHGRSLNAATRILEATLDVNEHRVDDLVQRLTSSGLRSFLILGVSHKPGTSDRTGSRSLFLADRLTQEGCHVLLNDPHAGRT